MTEAIRILGIDPGSRLTGFALLDVTNQGFNQVDYGVLRLGDKPFADRLHQIYEDIQAVILEFKPTYCAIEEIFVAHNVSSALKLGHARGAAIVAMSGQGLVPTEYTALQIKKAVVGKGRADKTQVQMMVRMLLNIHEPVQADAADALAVALCHAQCMKLNQKLAHQLGTKTHRRFRDSRFQAR